MTVVLIFHFVAVIYIDCTQHGRIHMHNIGSCKIVNDKSDIAAQWIAMPYLRKSFKARQHKTGMHNTRLFIV